MRITQAANVNPTPKRNWLIEPYVPAQEVTLLTGARRAGKGLFCSMLAALASRGQSIPFSLSPSDSVAPHLVLWLTREDSEDNEAEMRARFLAAGGDVNALSFGSMGRGDTVRDLAYGLEGDQPTLLIIDPLQAVLGNLSRQKARALMEQLVGLARGTNTTVVAIRHVTKSGVGRGRGEIADVVRSEIYLGHHPEDHDTYVMASAPSSYGEGEPQAFKIQMQDGSPAFAYMDEDWDDDVTWADLVPRPPKRRRAARPRTARERAATFLRERLKAAPQTRDVLLAGARRRRLSERTLERAATDLGLIRLSRREGKRIASSLWSLPSLGTTDRQTEEPPQPIKPSGVEVFDQSANLTPWRGAPFPAEAERLVLPSGEILQDAVIWPGFCQSQLDLDPGQLWADLLAIPLHPSNEPIPFRSQGDDPHWIQGDHPALNYRGNAIRRGKIWAQSDYAQGLRKYNYTGWQHRISYATHAVEHVEPIRLLAGRLNAGLAQPHTHWIATRYENEEDNIGFHNDKPGDFAEASWFIVIKLGEARPFAFQLPGDSKPFYRERLAAGTAVFVRANCPGAANARVKHGVPTCDPVGRSGSIVSRRITTVVPWNEVGKAITRSEKAREEKRHSA